MMLVLFEDFVVLFEFVEIVSGISSSVFIILEKSMGLSCFDQFVFTMDMTKLLSAKGSSDRCSESDESQSSSPVEVD